MSKGKTNGRSRKGAVAVMALLVAIVSAILFQAYMTHVLSDMSTGRAYDDYSQYQGERRALERMLKESIIEFYERPRMGQTAASLQPIITDYLSAMKNGSTVTYAVVLPLPTMPSNAVTYATATTTTTYAFWPKLTPDGDNDGIFMEAGETMAITTGSAFNLVAEALPDDLNKSHIAQYMPDTASVIAVKNGTNDTYTFQITRNDAGTGVNKTFTFYVRMFQVPITDFNLISYAIADTAADVPNSPPTLTTTMTDALKAPVAASRTYGLCLSKMDAPNGVTAGATPATSYPYTYRELFSAASSLWEWVFYNNNNGTAATNFMATLFEQRDGVNVLTDPYSGDVYVGTNSVSNMAGTTGFDPEYFTNTDYTGTRVNFNGYTVNANGQFLYNAAGALNYGHSVITDDLDGDGVAGTEGDAMVAVNHVPAYANARVAPQSVRWIIDLHYIANPTVGDLTLRRIYVNLPTNLTSEPIPNSKIYITDSTTGSVLDTSHNKPVIFCIEGWQRVNNDINDATYIPPANYTVELAGNLADQPMIIYAVGANVVTTAGGATSTIKGMLLLDDKLIGLSATVGLTVNGLLAWGGATSAPNPTTTVALTTNLTVNPSPAVNPFRAIAPRFLLVDVRSNNN